MKIIGLDVGKNYAVSCCLDEFPANIKQYFKQHRKEFKKLPTNKIGVAKLLAYRPDGIVLEPTGHWYSHFWYKVATEHNIDVYWMGHTDLDKQRGSYGFVNKRDDEDALCLAASYFDNRFIDARGNQRFINYYNDNLIGLLRETFLEKEQLAKLRTSLITQLRQRLSYEFPELAHKTLDISSFRNFTPVIGWLGGIDSDKRYDNFYAESVALSLNIEISDYTRSHARTLVDLEKRITAHYAKLKTLVEYSCFDPYNKVFNRFGFGIDNRALLLFHIYPLNKFLIDARPWIEYEESKGKMQERDRSLRKFQGFLGMSYKIKQSGDKTKRSFSGSSMVRAHLYAWAVCQIAPSKHGYRVNTKIGRTLTDRYIEMREVQKVKGKDALMRILFKATRMLFYELVNTIP